MGQIRTLLVLTAIGAWLGGAGIGGCGDIGASSRCETGRPPDDCPPETGDAGAGGDGTGADAGAARDASAPPPSETDAGPEDMAFGAREGDSLETPGASCFDGIDADEDGVTDCDDRSCGAHPYCCVGSTEAHCCTGPGRDLMLAFDMCTAGTAVTSCVEGVAGVGAGEATVVNGGFVANASSDTGIALDAAVNPRREYITLTATVETPPSACSDCQDAVAFGVGALPAPSATRFAPDVAAVVRLAFADVALVIAGEVIGRLPLELGVTRSHTLELTPSGEVTLHSEAGTAVVSGRWTATSDRRVLLFGRTPTATASPVVRTRSLSVSTAGCSMPNALRRAEAPEDVSGTDVSGTSASVVADGPVRLMVVADSGALTLLEAPFVDGPWRVREGQLWGGTARFTDPELAWIGGELTLFATEEDPESGPHLVRADLGADGRFGPPAPLTLPEAGHFRGASVVDFGGRPLLAAREVDAERIVVLESLDGGWTFDQELAAWSTGDSGWAFDADEVGDPELVEIGGLIRLYYAGRRGTRWALGMRLSGNATVWRSPLEDEAILTPLGVGTELLGIRSPDVLVEGDRLILFYTTLDGGSNGLGRAEGRAQ